ncbi:hypothetical protein [Cohnella caldifontis]|uniref:hypothetical protein n=1 Tax=Cohnella caldifontis TaxID=3027471 RepID=UPI0023EC5567|nr:hypothetical protein [Cohnella sp. YIM B05605]
MVQRQMSRSLKWISAIVVALGIVFCLANLAEFNDGNLGLMVGIGFLIGGLQILLFGTIVPLMHRMQEEPDRKPIRE